MAHDQGYNLQDLLAMPLGTYNQDGDILRVVNGWIYITKYTTEGSAAVSTAFVREPEEIQIIEIKEQARAFTLPEMIEAYSAGYKEGIDSPAAFLRPEQLNKRMKYDFKQRFNVELP